MCSIWEAESEFVSRNPYELHGFFILSRKVYSQKGVPFGPNSNLDVMHLPLYGRELERIFSLVNNVFGL